MRMVKCYGEKCVSQGLKYEKHKLISVGGKNYCEKCIVDIKEKIAERSKVKCYGEECMSKKIKHFSQELIELNGKRYCEKCHIKALKEEEGKKYLYKIIGEVYGVNVENCWEDYDAKQLMAHAKKLRADGMEYLGMAYTLIYIRDNVSSIKFEARYGLGIIARFYGTAKKHYEERRNISEMQKKSLSRESGVEVVHVKPLDTTNEIKKQRFIDMDVLEDECVVDSEVKPFDINDIVNSII